MKTTIQEQKGEDEYSSCISSNRFDIYCPEHEISNMPPILFLQGVNVDKSEYSKFASCLAKRGHNVIIPNCFQKNQSYICPNELSAKEALSNRELKKINRLQESLNKGVVLFGHSAGGIAAYLALSKHLKGTEGLPCPVLGISVYGSSVPHKIATNQMPPTLILIGNKDSIIPTDLAKKSYLENLANCDKAYVDLKDMNHYSLTNSGCPNSAPPERTIEIPKKETTENLALIVSRFGQAIREKDLEWQNKLINGVENQVEKYSEWQNKLINGVENQVEEILFERKKHNY